MSPVSTHDSLSSLDGRTTALIGSPQKLSSAKCVLLDDMRSAQLSLPQSLSLDASRAVADSEDSSFSSPTATPSPTALPTSTPASSGIPSPLEELREADMLKQHVGSESRRVLFNQWRPTSHFLGPHGWMNDPCGPSYDPRTGLYHLWYQWNPTASTWGNICWGHAYSRDLVHWTSRPQPVLVPGGNHDSQGVFTGCVLQRPPLGTAEEAAQSMEMTALYTAVSKLPIHHTLPYSYGSEKIVLSTSADGGETWLPHGVVVEGPPSELDVISWRDPYIAPWPLLDALLGSQVPGLYALIAGGIKDTTPTTFAYSINPSDLSQWSYIGTLADVGRNCKAGPYGVDLGQNWEVANFFTVADRHSTCSAEYLLINAEGCTEPGPARAPVYIKLDLEATQVGNGEIRLQPAHVGLLDHGCLYAASSFHDDKHDRRLMWGWITEDDLPESYYDIQGWAGCISLPRELFWHPSSDELGIRPASEVELLRADARLITVPAGLAQGLEIEVDEAALGGQKQLTAVPVDGIEIRSYELQMDLSATQPGLAIAHSTDLSTRTLVYITSTNQLVVDRTLSAGKRSVIDKQLEVNTCSLRAPLASTAGHTLRLFLDNSVLELFVDDVVALSTRIYADASDVGLSILAAPDAEIEGGQVWYGLDRAVL